MDDWLLVVFWAGPFLAAVLLLYDRAFCSDVLGKPEEDWGAVA
tara:strand:- start:115 stop:243 length:129 start_codon:yes stop_codon:yes gene_type:complete